VFARKKPCAFLVKRFSGHEIVPATIDFNRETRFRAVKINYVAIHRMLPKFPSLKLSIAQVAP
jgi:hypothetical protein